MSERRGDPYCLLGTLFVTILRVWQSAGRIAFMERPRKPGH